jgi:DNA-binding MarR family transcriptional regulator
VVLGQLTRRLRAEHRFPLSHGTVLGRLDREAPQSTSDLALAERVRLQSMAQTLTDLQADGLIERHPDPGDKRRILIELTDEETRGTRAGPAKPRGLARGIAESLWPEEQASLARAVELLERLTQGEASR